MTINSENLTISVPNKKDELCNKNCPYCISRMTGYITPDFQKMCRNILKVKTVANNARVTSVLFTGKGEPLYGESINYLKDLILKFKEYPIEIQTNGISLTEDIRLLGVLYQYGLDVLAISVDNPEQMEDIIPVIDECKEMRITTRLTFNITRLLNGYTFKNLIEYCKSNGVDQMTLRKVIAPEQCKNQKTYNWIQNNAGDKIIDEVNDEALTYIRKNAIFLRKTNFGVSIYDLDGVSFSSSEYCIQENSTSNKIRSLIFLEDGHLYTSWGSQASRLF